MGADCRAAVLAPDRRLETGSSRLELDHLVSNWIISSRTGSYRLELDHIMEDAGERLKKVRDRLDLTIRDVEEASRKIATRHKNDEFVVGLSRLSEIENKGVVPTIYRLYSPCSIYPLVLLELMVWYAVDLGELATDSAVVAITRT